MKKNKSLFVLLALCFSAIWADAQVSLSFEESLRLLRQENQRRTRRRVKAPCAAFATRRREPIRGGASKASGRIQKEPGAGGPIADDASEAQ